MGPPALALVPARVAATLRLKLIQDWAVSEEARRRAHWRGERKAVLVRVPIEVAEELRRAAEHKHRSVSEHAAALLAAALDSTEDVA